MIFYMSTNILEPIDSLLAAYGGDKKRTCPFSGFAEPMNFVQILTQMGSKLRSIFFQDFRLERCEAEYSFGYYSWTNTNLLGKR